jgi:CRISPR-associated protein Csb2
LLGYADRADADKMRKAVSIFRTLAAGLNCEEIEPGNRLQIIEDFRHDKVWRLFASSSCEWLSVTPVAIHRCYKVPTRSPDGQRLSSNERHIRRVSEWTNLLRASLRHIRLPEDLIASCNITLTPSPLLGGTERAERYRPKNERGPFVHARLEFRRPVRGPLLVGDGRYVGLGLFAPT